MRSKSNLVLALMVLVITLVWLPQESFASFALINDDQLTVDTWNASGTLYDQSQAWIVSGGSVVNLFAHDDSKVYISGGSVGNNLNAYNNSIIDISEGSVGMLQARHSCNITVSGGEVNGLQAEDSSDIFFSSGMVSGLFDVYDWSIVTFNAKNIILGNGLSLDNNNKLFGTGSLSGEWFDGTQWGVYISEYHSDSASILITPEPSMLLLFGLGTMMLRRKH